MNWLNGMILCTALLAGCRFAKTTGGKESYEELSPEVHAAVDEYRNVMYAEIARLSPTTNDVNLIARAVLSNLSDEREAIKVAVWDDDEVNYYFAKGFLKSMEGEQAYNRIVLAILDQRAAAMSVD